MPEATDIYLDDYHLHSLTDDLPTSVGYPLQGLESPAIRLSTYDNPGDHGQTVSNALYGARVVALQGRIRGEDVATYRANRQAFSQAVSLQNDASGFPITRLLKVSMGDGATWRLPVITSKFQNPEQYPTRSLWQLELTATQWQLESDTQSSGSVGLPQAGGSSFPWTFPLSFGGGGGGSTTLTNNGTTTAYPTITLTGPVISPVITNSTTGQKIQLSLTLLTGDTLVIDTRARTITQGGATNKIGAFVTGSTFWGLAPGENLITYSANQYDTSTASFVWRDAIGGL
jgi:phage-related protein